MNMDSDSVNNQENVKAHAGAHTVSAPAPSAGGEKRSVKSILLAVLFCALGSLVVAFALNQVLKPAGFSPGGVTGLSAILQYATHGVIKIGYSYFVINVALIIAALFVLGFSFGWKTIYATVLASIGLNLFQGIIPADFIQAISLDNGKLMSTIMGGIMVGVGIGLTMVAGGSTGGTDIIALMVNKYRNVSPGRLILYMDVVVILSSLLVPSYKPDGGLVPFVEKLTTVVYGFILITINSTVLDLVITGSRQSVQLFILSKHYAKIADAITKDLHRGVTVLDGKGWYTKEQTEVLMVLTRKTDLNLLLRYIKAIDPAAFLSVSSVTGVYGKGFDEIKKKM